MTYDPQMEARYRAYLSAQQAQYPHAFGGGGLSTSAFGGNPFSHYDHTQLANIYRVERDARKIIEKEESTEKIKRELPVIMTAFSMRQVPPPSLWTRFKKWLGIGSNGSRKSYTIRNRTGKVEP